MRYAVSHSLAAGVSVMGSFSLWHWVLVLAVVLLVFGTKRLRGAGRDLGEAIKGFKKGMSEGDTPPAGELGDPSQHRKNANQSPSRKNTEDTPR